MNNTGNSEQNETIFNVTEVDNADIESFQKNKMNGFLDEVIALISILSDERNLSPTAGVSETQRRLIERRSGEVASVKQQGEELTEELDEIIKRDFVPDYLAKQLSVKLGISEQELMSF